MNTNPYTITGLDPSNLGKFKGLVEGSEIEIWYMRDDFFSEGICGITKNIDPQNLEKTHILLGTIKGTKSSINKVLTSNETCEEIYYALQGENWSPFGEATCYIYSRNLSHTTMSIGDVIRFVRDNNPQTFVVKSFGFGTI
jgi:hypothetical protein